MQNVRLLLARVFQDGLCATIVSRWRSSSKAVIAAKLVSRTRFLIAHPSR